MCNKYFGGEIPKYKGQKNEVDKEFEEFALKTHKNFEKLIDEFEMANSLQEIWNLISRTNKYIDETMPWSLAKEMDENKEAKEKLESCIYHLVENLRRIAILISPFMVGTAKNMFNQLGIESENLKSWESLDEYNKLENIKVIEKGEPLFMRLDVEKEVEYIKEKMSAK